MEYVIIQSKVAGGHYLSDMEIMVPSDKTLKVKKVHLEKSSDLKKALQEGTVEKRGSIREKAPSPDSGDLPTHSTSPVEDPDSESEKDLQAVNEELLATIRQLLDRQNDLLSKLNQYMDRPVEVTIDGSDLPSSQSNSTSSSPTRPSQSEEPVFIPKSSSSKAKVSGSMTPEEESTKSSASIDDAAEALKNLDS